MKIAEIIITTDRLDMPTIYPKKISLHIYLVRKN